jgi:hypothetical protein
MADFLQKLVDEIAAPVFLILDKHPVHNARAPCATS